MQTSYIPRRSDDLNEYKGSDHLLDCRSWWWYSNDDEFIARVSTYKIGRAEQRNDLTSRLN